MLVQDLIYQVPHCLNFLTGRRLHNLACTNQELHQQICSCAQGVSWAGKGRIPTVSASKWLDLKRLSISCDTLHTDDVDVIARADLPKLQHIKLKCGNATPALVAGLGTGNWTALQHLDLAPAARILDAACLTNLVKADCQGLVSLSLWRNRLQKQAMLELGQAKWPALQQLSLHACSSSDGIGAHFSICLSPEFMQQLLPLWPKLQGLDMPRSGLADERYGLVSELGKTLPHLTRLKLGEDSDEGQSGGELSQCHWTGLKQLRLHESHLGMSGMLGLQHTQWPLLEIADLGYNMLGADEILVLSQARWPMLRDLRLYSNNLDAQALRNFQTGSWPLLRSLDISSCLHHTAAPSERRAFVEALIACKMPCLTHLDLGCNELTDVDLITSLILGDWPCLRHLNLSGNFFEHIPITLFGVDHCMILEQESYKFGQRFAGQFAKRALACTYMYFFDCDVRSIVSDMMAITS